MKKLTKRISNILLKMRFKPEHKGTKFIEKCIEIATKEKHIIS